MITIIIFISLFLLILILLFNNNFYYNLYNCNQFIYNIAWEDPRIDFKYFSYLDRSFGQQNQPTDKVIEGIL